MKVIIYFLLICNIGFAAWHFQGLGVSKDDSSSEVEINHENQLILLTEFKKNDQAELVGKLCYSLGPFIKKSQANKAQNLLKESDFGTERIQLRDTSRTGYWVTLPASKTPKEIAFA